MYKIAAENLQALFQKIAADQDLYLPVKVSDQVNFRAWSQDAEVCLDTLKTVKSPKDAFFPQSENLYTCEKEGKNITIEPQALQEKKIPYAFHVFSKEEITEPSLHLHVMNRKRAVSVRYLALTVQILLQMLQHG